MPSALEYSEFLKSIISLGNSGISKGDKTVLLDLLKTLRYTCEFSILRHCYDENRSLKVYVYDIDSKLNKIKKNLEELEEKRNSVGLNEFDQVKFKANSISYNRYQEIRKVIVERDFEHYIESMNQNVDSGRQIIAICSSVLADANIDYVKEFFVNGSRKNALDIIYDIKNDKDLAGELTKFYKYEKSAQVEDEEAILADKKFLEYVQLAKQNESLMREYMDVLIRVGMHDEDKEVVLCEKISRSKIELVELSSGVLANLRNSKEIMSLEARIKKYEEDLKKAKEYRPKLEGLEEEVRKAGLGVIVDQFHAPNSNLDTSIEQRVVDFLKLTMNKNSFDISAIEAKITKDVEYLEKQIKKRDTLVNGLVNGLSPYAKELVTRYHDEGENIMNVVNGRLEANVTPLLSAYVLKMLFDSKRLSFDEIGSIAKVYNGKGVSSLVETYENIVKKTTEVLGEHIHAVESRVPYDIKEFDGELKVL